MPQYAKIGLDILMYAVFLYLMSYRPGRGLWLHGVWGCILFALFVLHHVINRQWYGRLCKGKYPPVRIVFNGLDALLFVAMVLMAVSSVLMSGDVFSFSPFYQTQFARSLHTLSVSWGFVLMLLHVGLHLHGFLIRLRRRADSSALYRYAFWLLFSLLLALGLYFFAASHLWQRMLLLQTGSTPFTSELRFYTEYLLISVAFCQLMHLLLTGLQKLQQKPGHKAGCPPVRARKVPSRKS